MEQEETAAGSCAHLNGAYGDMVLVPKSLYKFFLSSSQMILPSINSHIVARNVNNARANASNPPVYNHYMNRAILFKKNAVDNPDVANRIRMSLTDPELQRIQSKLGALKRNKTLLRTTMGMKTYKKLLTDRSTQMSVLEESEHNKFRQFVNNPQNTVTPSPQSQADVPYSTRVLRQTLAGNPDLINTDVSGRMYVDKKLVSDNPHQAGKIIHFITHDYSDLSRAPEGTKELLAGLKRRGFNMRDIGNTYLRESLLGQTPLHDRKRSRIPVPVARPSTETTSPVRQRRQAPLPTPPLKTPPPQSDSRRSVVASRKRQRELFPSPTTSASLAHDTLPSADSTPVTRRRYALRSRRRSSQKSKHDKTTHR